MATWQDVITAAQTLLQRWKRDVDFTSQIVNGPATGPTSVVNTDGGTIPTFQNVLSNVLTGNNATQLLAWAYVQDYQLVSATRDANGAITTATIKWPDGISGVFTTDAVSTAFPGTVDAYHVTWVSGTITKIVTQPAVTRDANGAVTAQPALTIS